jgi:hypothetical protein
MRQSQAVLGSYSNLIPDLIEFDLMDKFILCASANVTEDAGSSRVVRLSWVVAMEAGIPSTFGT